VGNDAGTIPGLTPSSLLSTVIPAVSAMMVSAIRWLSLRLLLATKVTAKLMITVVLSKIDHGLSESGENLKH
jgi:hypothetical protein